MRKINKIINIASISVTGIIMLWHCNIAYSLPAQERALRPQIGIVNQRIIQELLLQLEEKDQVTAGILKERLELMDSSDIDGLKYIVNDLTWFLNNNRTNNIYYIPKESPKVSFIIVHYGESPHGTLSLLRSLKNQTYQNFDIVLIDNNSPDSFYKDFDSYDIPREIRGRITFIHNRSNLGYCGGNNQGSRIAIEKKSDYVFLINNDGILENDGLAKMIDAVKNHPEIGVLQPYIYMYNEEESSDIEIMKKTGNLPQATRAKAESGIKIFMESISKSSRWIINAVQGIDGLYYREPLVSGTAQLVRSDMIRLSGGFDNRLFMYGDAWDIGYKYYITGLKKAMLTSVFVAHPAFDPLSELPYNFRSQYLVWRNHMFNAEQFYNKSAFGRRLIKRGFNFQFLRGTNPPISAAGAPSKEPRSAIDILQMRLKACSAKENTLMFIAIFKGVADGLLGNFKPTLESELIDEKRITEDYAVQFKEMHSAFDIFKCIFSEQDAHRVRLMIFALYQNRNSINIEKALPEELQGRLINILVQYVNKWEAWIKSKERNPRDIASIREDFLMDVKKVLASNEVAFAELLRQEFPEYLNNGIPLQILDIGTGHDGLFTFRLKELLDKNGIKAGICGIALNIMEKYKTEAMQKGIVLKDMSYEDLVEDEFEEGKYHIVTLNAPDFLMDMNKIFSAFNFLLASDGILIIRLSTGFDNEDIKDDIQALLEDTGLWKIWNLKSSMKDLPEGRASLVSPLLIRRVHSVGMRLGTLEILQRDL